MVHNDLWWDPSANSVQKDLARFVLGCREDAELMAVYRKAQERLKRDHPSFDAFHGYDSSRRQDVIDQLECLYNTVAAASIALTTQATDFPDLGPQMVRRPTSVFQAAQANCIDITVLLAALAVRAGLNPLILVGGPANSARPDHAILGCWLSDHTLPDVQVGWPTVRSRLREMVFVECLGMLDGKCRLSFREAMAEAAWSLPQDDRGALSQHEPTSSPRCLSRADKRISYAVDVRSALTRRDPCVISIMGAKGGVGKTTIAARMAELVAESGNSVLIIDVDVESAGTTILHRRRTRKNVIPGVKTVYDHIRELEVPDVSRLNHQPSMAFSGLEDVTPRHLEEPRFGRMYLIPARPITTVDDRWEVLADLNPATRNESLLFGLDAMFQRLQSLPPEPGIGCIILDCGAEFNPLVSAAFHKADYGFVVANPDPICFDNVTAFDTSHRARFPTLDLGKIQIIVNRVQSEAQETFWKGSQRLAGFVPDDPELQRDWFHGRLSFEYGYGEVSRRLVAVLSRVLRPEHRVLVPDEISAWIAPWWRVIKTNQVPRRMLDPKFDPEFKPGKRFRQATALSRLGIVASLAAIVAAGILIARPVGSAAPSASVAALRLPNVPAAERARQDLAAGQDFFDVGRRYQGVPLVGALSVLPPVDQTDVLDKCLRTTAVGAICSDPISAGGQPLLVRVLAGPTQGSGSISILAALLRLTGVLLLIAALAGLLQSLRTAWMQHQRTRVLKSLDAATDPRTMAKHLGLDNEESTRPDNDDVDSDEEGVRIAGAIVGSLPLAERRIVQLWMGKRQVMQWLHSLLEEERLKQKLANL